MKRRTVISAGLVMLAAVLGISGLAQACAKSAPAPAPTAASSDVKWPETVRTGVVVASGTTYVISQAMGETVKKYTPIKYWTGLPLGGIAGFGPEFQKGQMEVAMLNGPSLSNLLLGINDAQPVGPAPIRSMLAAQPRGYVWYVHPKANIKSLKDLKGKRVYSGVTGNLFVNWLAKLMLESVGMKESDLGASLSGAGRNPFVPDLIERKVDAFLYPEVPELILELNKSIGEVEILPLTKEQADFVVNKQPGMFAEVMPAGRSGVLKEVKYITSYYNNLVAYAGLHPEVVYGIVKAIWEHRDDWVGVHPQAKEIVLEQAVHTSVPLYHEGAIKYYKEKGVWTADAQKWQDGQIAKLKSLGLLK